MISPLEWDNDRNILVLIDQRKLPHVQEYIEVNNLESGYAAIKEMVVRGAPLIGFTALWTMVAHLHSINSYSFQQFNADVNYLVTARPTAVNLQYELERARSLAQEFNDRHGSLDGFVEKLASFAQEQMDLLHKNNLQMAKFARLDLETRLAVRAKYTLMTLCNTGILACGPMGTALGVISYLFECKKVKHVYASETRPYLQGSRLTSFELMELGIPHEITVEGAASYLLREKQVDAIYVGADRIAANGDTANKVGTSSLAIIAQYYQVPFYVVAPSSSFDLSLASGKEIPIELRDEQEVLSYKGTKIAPEGARALNPSFDITNAELITGIICEKGIINPQHKGDVRKILMRK